MSNKVIIFSAPSGSGKSTIVNHILKLHPEMEFSVSATSRQPRGSERDGVEYHFLTPDEFRRRIAERDFLRDKQRRNVTRRKTKFFESVCGVANSPRSLELSNVSNKTLVP